jgi:hypothetical protein
MLTEFVIHFTVHGMNNMEAFMLFILYILLTVHLGTIPANDYLVSFFFLNVFIYFTCTCFEQQSAHHQEIDCINTSSGMY